MIVLLKTDNPAWVKKHRFREVESCFGISFYLENNNPDELAPEEFTLLQSKLGDIFQDPLILPFKLKSAIMKSASEIDKVKVKAKAALASEGKPDTLLSKLLDRLLEPGHIIERSFRVGVSQPLAQTLAQVLALKEDQIRIDQIVWIGEDLDSEKLSNLSKELRMSWCEPAIEEIRHTVFLEWFSRVSEKPVLKVRNDDSFEVGDPSMWGLEFSKEELDVLMKAQKAQLRDWTRAEWEVFAQTWSEHCKHKIFAAKIETKDTVNAVTEGLFSTHIRNPANRIFEKFPGRCLSAFHDNAGVLSIKASDGSDTEWAVCLKMETHNSPSAISPYGGASTGIVGVHRDILGTGQGAMPIANWDVLCFENQKHNVPRPQTALPADIIRSGVIRGIEEGGNQSGIPTLQGSVVFDPSFAVKPLVFAGSVGLLPKKYVNKKPRAGLALFCFGGAVGADGLRGAVMSSRDLRQEDFVGSAVQVASPFVQRRMTEFLLQARDLNLIDVITDNGAGGLASSCGEMATLSGGARIDVTSLRLKYQGLHGWERLLSESQERMSVATSQSEKLEDLARKWNLEFDRLGELTDSGFFEVRYQGQTMVKISLQLLHEGCPKMKLKSDWTAAKEKEFLQNLRPRFSREPKIKEDFIVMLESDHLCSRQGIVRRFDHEVQGRTLKKPFAGSTQNSPQDGSLIEIYETDQRSALVLSHGLAPWRKNIVENVAHSFDEALRSAVLCGMQWETSGMLDNFCWPDPIVRPEFDRAHRHLWRLVKANETLSELCEFFEIPLISGKDSMKNNSKDFDATATLVMSLGASAGPVENLPKSFFTRANEVVYVLPPLLATLQDSAWERALQTCTASKQNDFDQEMKNVLPLLKDRYESLLKLIHRGLIRSAKDVSEGGLLTSVFEMCLGREFGFVFENPEPDGDFCFAEGLGGFVFSVDPHHSSEIELSLPQVKRLGVVMRPSEIWFASTKYFDVPQLRESYHQKNHEGFWL